MLPNFSFAKKGFLCFALSVNCAFAQVCADAKEPEDRGRTGSEPAPDDPAHRVYTRPHRAAKRADVPEQRT